MTQMIQMMLPKLILKPVTSPLKIGDSVSGIEPNIHEDCILIDPELSKIWKVIEKQKIKYKVEAPYKTIHYEDRDIQMWGESWFPPCIMVYCFKR